MMDYCIQLIIASSRLWCEGLSLILAREPNFELVGEALDGPQAIDLCCRLKPDVLLSDLTEPEINSLRVIQSIKDEGSKTKPLVITAFQSETEIFAALKVGAKGFISKRSSSRELVKAIHAVHGGELWVERKLVAKYIEAETISDYQRVDGVGRKGRKLTPRELDVLCCLPKGSTNKEIADILCISEKTVKCHMNSIFKKLGISQRLQATIYAIQRGLN
jgi:DNA-binding NarL/FixJ family response regulator